MVRDIRTETEHKLNESSAGLVELIIYTKRIQNVAKSCRHWYDSFVARKTNQSDATVSRHGLSSAMQRPDLPLQEGPELQPRLDYLRDPAVPPLRQRGGSSRVPKDPHSGKSGHCITMGTAGKCGNYHATFILSYYYSSRIYPQPLWFSFLFAGNCGEPPAACLCRFINLCMIFCCINLLSSRISSFGESTFGWLRSIPVPEGLHNCPRFPVENILVLLSPKLKALLMN